MKPKITEESKAVSISKGIVLENYSRGHYAYECNCISCLRDLSAVTRSGDGFRRCPDCSENVPPCRFLKSEKLPDQIAEKFGPREDPPNCKQIEKGLLKEWLIEKHCVRPDGFTREQIVNLIVKLTRAYGEIEIVSSDQEPLAVYFHAPHPTPPTSPESWQKLGECFKGLEDGDEILAIWDLEISSGKETWQLGSGPQQSLSMFKRLVRQAAVTLGYPGGEDGIDVWLSLLQRDNDTEKTCSAHNGRANIHLYRLCTASVNYCQELKTLAMENGRSRHEKDNTDEFPTETGEHSTRLKRGPKSDIETFGRLLGIVNKVTPDGHWKSKLKGICEMLDSESVPFPIDWKQRGYDSWVECFDLEKSLVVKAVDYRLKKARKG